MNIYNVIELLWNHFDSLFFEPYYYLGLDRLTYINLDIETFFTYFWCLKKCLVLSLSLSLWGEKVKNIYFHEMKMIRKKNVWPVLKNICMICVQSIDILIEQWGCILPKEHMLNELDTLSKRFYEIKW